MEISLKGSRKKFYILSSLTLLFGFIISALFNFYISKESLSKQILNESLPLTINSIHTDIKNDLIRPVNVSKMMSNDTFLHQWIREGEQEKKFIESYLISILQSNYDKKIFTSYYISDKTKRYYHPNGKERYISKDNPEESWYFTAKHNRNDYEIVISEDEMNNNNLTVFVNYKTIDSQGNFLGIIGVGMTLDTVNSILDNYRKKYNKKIYFANKNGKLIFRDPLLLNKMNIKNLSYFENHYEKMFSNKSISFTNNRHGNIHFISSKFIEELNWYLIVEDNNPMINRYIYNALYWHLLGAFLFTVIFTYLIFLNFKTYHHKRYSLIGTTISFILHQWKQPLSVISAHILNIQNKIYSKPTENLSIIKNDIEKIENKISFLKMTSLSIRNLVLEESAARELFTINEALKILEEQFQNTFSNKGINYTKEVSPHLSLFGDQTLFINTLAAIIDNSYHAICNSKISSPYIKLKAKLVGDSIKIEIEDNGGGINIEPIEKVFDIFVTDKTNGTGLGLALVKKTIEEIFQGDIHIKNSNKGVLISITIPKYNK